MSLAKIGAPPFPFAAFFEKAAAVMAPRVEGFVDRRIADEVIGWAYDRLRPQRRVLVVARIDGKIVSEALADLPRRDIEELGKGDGRYGFRLKLPPGLNDRERDGLSIEAKVGWHSVRLKFSKRFKFQDAPPSLAVPVENRGPTAGFLERISGGTLKGWAVNPNDPTAIPSVDIFEGELFLGSIVADIDRPRLRETDAPSGARGFAFRLPADRQVSAEALRARITGTRIDLRHSRGYLSGPSADEIKSPSERGPPSNGVSARLGAPPAVSPRHKIGFLICDCEQSTDLDATRSSLNALDLAEAAPIAAWGISPSSSYDIAVIGKGNEASLRAFFADAERVVLLKAGQVIESALAKDLVVDCAAADVLCWGVAAAGPAISADIDLFIALGASAAGLAVRGNTLSSLSTEELERLSTDGLRGLAAVLADHGLAWRLLDHGHSKRLARSAGSTWIMEPPHPRRISLAVWNDWTEEPPQALFALLDGCSGFDVEVLCPATSSNAVERIKTRANSALQSLSIRLIDAPPDADGKSNWRAMARAASGQVVIICDGSVSVPPNVVIDVARWAYRRDVAAVTVSIINDRGDVLAGLALEEGADLVISAFDPSLSSVDRPVAAAPAAFMAVARTAIAQVDRLADKVLTDEFQVCAHLRRCGRRSVLLGRHSAHIGIDRLDAWLRPGFSSNHSLTAGEGEPDAATSPALQA